MFFRIETTSVITGRTPSNGYNPNQVRVSPFRGWVRFSYGMKKLMIASSLALLLSQTGFAQETKDVAEVMSSLHRAWKHQVVRVWRTWASVAKYFLKELVLVRRLARHGHGGDKNTARLEDLKRSVHQAYATSSPRSGVSC